MRFRFSIRDLLWLTLVVALAAGWFVDRSRSDAPKAGRGHAGNARQPQPLQRDCDGLQREWAPDVYRATGRPVSLQRGWRQGLR